MKHHVNIIFLGFFLNLCYGIPTGKVVNIDRSLDNSTSSGCGTIHGAEPDENCMYHVGDMIFTQEELLEAYGDTTRNGIDKAKYRWPGNWQVKGLLAYEFDRKDIESGSPEEKFIKRVIERFNIDLKGCLKIVPRTTESDYVKVGKNPSAGKQCESMVGMIDQTFQPQELDLDGVVGGIANNEGGCYSDRTVVHEFIHAWGFTHEQNRPDRDSFITINSANLIPGQFPGTNFDKKPNYLTYGVQYNGLSVMHYHSKAFSKDPDNLDTLISKRPELFTTNQMGTNDWMTLGDVAKLREMYGCNSGSCKNKYSSWCQKYADKGYCEVDTRNNNPSTWQKNFWNYCKPACNTCNGVCKDEKSTSQCQKWAKREDVSCIQDKADKKHVGFMQENCRKTCDFCPANCKDNAKEVAKCPEYKNDGWCKSSHTNFEYMQIYCRRTCKFCIGPGGYGRMDINDANLDLSLPELEMELNDGDDTELPELPPPDMKIESDDWIAEPLDSKISIV